MITDSGFSCPSTVPCCSAVNTSVNAIGVGMIPNARYAWMCTGFSIVRILSPFRSSGPLTGCLLFVMLRKPFSPQASASMPFGSNFFSISWPIGPSSTARACA